MSITLVNCVLFELTEKLVLEAGLITPFQTHVCLKVQGLNGLAPLTV